MFRALIALIMLFHFYIPATANATVLTFDDIGSAGMVPNGYGGLNWNNLIYINSTMFPNSGYFNSVVSGRHVAFNGSGLTASINNGSFDFNSAYFTAAFCDGLNIEVKGYNNGDLLYNQIILVNTQAPTHFIANYIGIDSLQFNSFGGVDNLDLLPHSANAAQFAMDDFTFNHSSTPVPEPSTLLLLGIGLGGLAVFRGKIHRS